MDTTATRAWLPTGVGLHYVEQGPPATEETVVLVHGWPDSAYSYHRVLAELPADHRAVTMDLRGFGDSDRPAGGYAIDDLAADVAALIETLGQAEVTLVGHSMGSFVARRVAQQRPDLVRRLVLIGTAVSADNAVLREVADLVRDLPDPVPADFTREFAASTLHQPVPEDFFDTLVDESRKAPARVWRAALAGLVEVDDAAELERITAHTLVLGGEQDALFTVAEQIAVAAAIPRSRLTLYPDTGHCPNWERPAQVAADISAFIRET
ncbi:alpha/beta hydrolase [Actinomycetospora lutea]|uniref:alpha/beta fold hydrolase n=1 Tax=Actinomycetospora lutea TaxID=663604 RepID=UPI002366F8B3|nr:alpha/beta hydrolase [Actinomycetospora lutea]MDD7942848.1 alpha/beta hydrolase [Actinomycetospora lutea]